MLERLSHKSGLSEDQEERSGCQHPPQKPEIDYCGQAGQECLD